MFVKIILNLIHFCFFFKNSFSYIRESPSPSPCLRGGVRAVPGGEGRGQAEDRHPHYHHVLAVAAPDMEP